MHDVHFRSVHSYLRKMALLKYFNCIEPSKEERIQERIQSVLHKSYGPLVHLMLTKLMQL